MPDRGSTKVGVFGAGGRMGAAVCEAVSAADGLELVAAVDPNHVGRSIAGIAVSADPRALADAGAEVAVDFTVAAAARTNLQWCALHGVHAVVGTTGLDQSDVDGFRKMFTSSNCLIAANFAISAVLMMKFAEMAAPFFDTAEIIELHHDNKADAPSGTAVSTAERMAASSSQWAGDPTTHEVYPGARGARGPDRHAGSTRAPAPGGAWNAFDGSPVAPQEDRRRSQPEG
ncbi:MAG: 4-hydroxy-tetrahydrodipicolinate reductase, partial [Actinomycetota bacterium]